MASRLCFCPCSALPSSGFLSNGSNLGNFERMISSKPLCYKKSERAGSSMPFAALEEQQDKPSNSSLDTHGFQRRQAVLGGLMAALLLPSTANRALSLPSGNPEVMRLADAPMAIPVDKAVQVDEINAYSYEYPVGVAQQNIRWVESRKPERYSSAAPLSPDARQRIVSERLNFQNNLVVSVSVGPPNSTFLKDSDPSTWDAKDVARSVLTDKSTARMTTGQRVAEISILETKTEEKDGVRYWYYEYMVQKSPTIKERSLDVYRHSTAVTAEREGYLYSLNASTSGKRWQFFEPMLKEAVDSFRLDAPTTEYVPPYKDPWRFW
ncbi:unnamed protein product [Calypogeia fissa]